MAENFDIDDLNRLTGSTVYTGISVSGASCAGGSPATTLGFKYDAVGNITSKTLAGVTSTYTYDPSHPYAVDSVTNLNGGSYSASYDNDGNMVTRNGNAITWTPANLPSSIEGGLGSSTFNYGPDGNRYYQYSSLNGVTTQTTYIAGGLFEVVSTSSGSTEYRHNIVADGQIIAVHTITAGSGAVSTSYLHYDQLGSVDAITNAAGAVIQSMSFDAFGNRRLATNWDYGVSQNTLATLNDDTNRGYTDQEELDNLSLVDMNGRVYDPTVGRFISADPTVSDPLYSQAFDRFGYAYNNPLIWIDPSGYTNWPLLGLGLLHLGTGASSLIGGSSLAISGILVVAAGAGTSEFGVGLLLIGAGGGMSLMGMSNAATGLADIAQSSQEIYSSVFGNGSVPPDALTQIYGPTTGSILTDTSFIHDLLDKATQTVAEKLLEDALKQAAEENAKRGNTNKQRSHGGGNTSDNYPGYGGGGGPGMLPPSWEVNPPQSGGAPSYNPPPPIQLLPVNVTPSNSSCKPTDPCM